MVDREVEKTLREIRERVLAETAAGAQSLDLHQTASAHSVSENSVASNGAGATNSDSSSADALARLEANLATAERAWNRLPPLMSNRNGWAARLELWIKRKIKRATHWYTWEQVNFNSSVYHALRDMRAAFSAYERQTASMRAEIGALRQVAAESDARLSEANARATELSSHVSELNARSTELNTRLAASEARRDAEGAQLRGALASAVEQLRAEQHALIEGLRREEQERVDALRNEERERVENLLDEQRVCFKQLSLEVSETTVLNDRVRRDVLARLEEFSRRLEGISATSDK